MARATLLLHTFPLTFLPPMLVSIFPLGHSCLPLWPPHFPVFPSFVPLCSMPGLELAGTWLMKERTELAGGGRSPGLCCPVSCVVSGGDLSRQGPRPLDCNGQAVPLDQLSLP